MEGLILVLIIVLIILTIRTKSAFDRKFFELHKKIDVLKTEIVKLSKSPPVNPVNQEKTAGTEISKPLTTPDISVYARPSVSPAKEELKTELQEPLSAATGSNTTEEKTTQAHREEKAPPVIKPVENPIRPPQRIPLQPKPKEKTFFEKYPDLEKFIGENLINKIGIAILVLGIGFFVKFAIDKDWINEIGRVAIGIVSGGILIAFAHKMRKDFKGFSSVLIGGGMAVFYFTIAIAFHEYKIFTQTEAFVIMIIITAFTIFFSLSYNRIELAVLAIIGGYASPFMVSTGEGNYIVLFTYILTLNLGMLILAYFKKWNLVNYVSYVFTILLFGGWLLQKVKGNPDAPYIGALIFATIFYFVFFMMNVINNLKEKRKFIAAEISILISNTFLYYSAGMFILNNIGAGKYQGLFTACIALFNFIFAYSLFKSKKADNNVVYLLIGLVLTFASLAAPVQLEGNYITLFWSLEAVLLLWLSQKSGIKIIKSASIIIIGLMLISLVMDWNNIYNSDLPMAILINKGFVTSLVSLISLFLTIKLLKNENETMFYFPDRHVYKNALTFIFVVVLYLTGLLELNFQLTLRVTPESLITMVLGSYNLLFILGLMFALIRYKQKEYDLAAIAFGTIGSFIYITYYVQSSVVLRENYLFDNTATLGAFLYHYLPSLIALIIISLAIKIIAKEVSFKTPGGKIGLWYFIFAIVVIFSVELDHIVLHFTHPSLTDYDYYKSQNHKIGFPLLWGIFSFILMVIGMKRKNKDLRIISLTLFTILLLKLFIIDIREISEGGKIAAFICLGLLLLIISFMYQKLKKLVTEDEPKSIA